ncbi:hypothetical protein PR048_000434 [Dryococelus australis]|uniref:Uncharacterized protein n=1 Tax=Dryococelus australis TaxID=614101 RepID=A0ABQ9IEM0_9NEOP|nr:hypothetical protein PR048_000434 [Dryococelus australis]
MYLGYFKAPAFLASELRRSVFEIHTTRDFECFQDATRNTNTVSEHFKMTKKNILKALYRSICASDTCNTAQWPCPETSYRFSINKIIVSPLKSLALSGDGALDMCGNVAFISSVLLTFKNGIKLLAGKWPKTSAMCNSITTIWDGIRCIQFSRLKCFAFNVKNFFNAPVMVVHAKHATIIPDCAFVSVRRMGALNPALHYYFNEQQRVVRNFPCSAFIRRAMNYVHATKGSGDSAHKHSRALKRNWPPLESRMWCDGCRAGAQPLSDRETREILAIAAKLNYRAAYDQDPGGGPRRLITILGVVDNFQAGYLATTMCKHADFGSKNTLYKAVHDKEKTFKRVVGYGISEDKGIRERREAPATMLEFPLPPLKSLIITPKRCFKHNELGCTKRHDGGVKKQRNEEKGRNWSRPSKPVPRGLEKIDQKFPGLCGIAIKTRFEIIIWSSAGTERRGKREIPEKTRRPAASSSTIPTCENPGANPPGIDPESPRWEYDPYQCYEFQYAECVSRPINLTTLVCELTPPCVENPPLA